MRRRVVKDENGKEESGSGVVWCGEGRWFMPLKAKD